MQKPLEGMSLNFLHLFFFLSLLYFLYGDVVNARCILYPASINEVLAPDTVFVFIKTSYKIFYRVYIGYSPAGRSISGKTVLEALDTARGRRPRAQFFPIRIDLGW